MGVTSGAAGRRSWAGCGSAGGSRPAARIGAGERPPLRRVVVEVDGSPECAAALRRAASQARQRNATLDVVRVIAADADDRVATLARVRLAEFTRRACPDGIGAPMRLRVERGDLALAEDEAGAELIIAPRPGAGGEGPSGEGPSGSGPSGSGSGGTGPSGEGYGAAATGRERPADGAARGHGWGRAGPLSRHHAHLTPHWRISRG